MPRPKTNGPYAKLSATYYLDDAILDAGPEAELLFTRCLAFTAQSSSDGFITERQMKTVGIGLRNVPRRVESLLRVGILTHGDGGYLIRGWLKWNKSATEIGRELRQDRERKARKHAEEEAHSARNPDGFHPDSSDQYKAKTSQGKSMSSTIAPSVLANGFEAAWSHWPKKVERKRAVDEFKAATRRLDITELVNAIIRFGNAYADTTERNFVPALNVWLKNDRWTDELPTSQKRQTRTEQNLDFVAELAREEQYAYSGQREIDA